ncbi:MAG: ATP-binding cassette domain-containing protein [Saprospiraceae bacterium]|nr:ATP-binding cassette domain-containing protein [Saprospiraceae bacterium]
MARRRWDDNDDAPKTKLTKESLREALQMYNFIRPYRWSFWIGMILLFLSTTTFMIFPFLSGRIVDIAQGKHDFTYELMGKTYHYYLDLARIGYFMAGLLIVQGLVSYFRVTLFAKVSEYGIADVKQALYQKLTSLPIPFFEKTRVGELVSRINSDVEKLYNTFSITLGEFVRQVLVLISGILILTLTTWKLSLVMLATFPIIVVGAIFFGRFIRKMSKDRQSQIADTNIILNETMMAINAVKAFTNEWFEVTRFSKANHKAVATSMKFASWRALFATFIIVVLFGALFFVLWQGATMLQAGEITAGELIMFFTYTAIIGGSIAGLGNFYTELVGAIGATERVREILNTPSEVEVKNHPVLPEKRLKGDIQFDNVKFRYPTREDVEVLRGVNLSIKAGQKVALVGASGAGKSTIMQLVLRFHEHQEGTIFVDGKPMKDYDITEYRQNLALVPQEVLLFGGTIRENILYGKPDATEAEIIDAAKKSNSWDFISQFPEGLDTIVGERGIKLSGGQRQRIAIARAILRNPSILLLDEATSSLDAESEKVVQDALNLLMENRTSIIIAHRLATIREVDKIYVLDGGQIVEAGTHEELSEIENGIYASLAKLQFDLVN